MRSWLKRRKLVLLLALVGLILAVAGYDYKVTREQEQVASDCEQAQAAAATALIAIRDGDLQRLQTVLYTASGDWLVNGKSAWRMPKMVAHTSSALRLESLGDTRIRDSLAIAPKQPERLLTSILRWSVPASQWQHVVENPVDALLVKCDLPKHALVIMCVKEGSSWKIVALPGLSAKVLRYRTIDEASAHNDAIEE